MHWGQKIITGMVLFMLFIGAMAYYMITHHKDTLIEDDYYEKGLQYDEQYRMKKNALDTTARPSITLAPGKVIVVFREASNYDIALQRPSDGAMDKHFKDSIAANTPLIIPVPKQGKGLWNVEITWSASGKKYLFKKEIFVHEP